MTDDNTLADTTRDTNPLFALVAFVVIIGTLLLAATMANDYLNSQAEYPPGCGPNGCVIPTQDDAPPTYGDR